MTGAALSFDPRVHEYRRPDGRVVPSVTQVLRAVGISADYAALAKAFGSVEAVARKRELGRRVHEATQAYDDGDLDLRHVNADVLAYVEAWAIFRANHKLTPVLREHRLYAEALGIAGTVDGVFYRDDDADRLILVDMKTGDVTSSAARYQTAGYEELWNAEYPTRPIAERWAVELTPERAVPYRVHNFTQAIDSWRDAHFFRAFVLTFHHQSRRGAP